MVDILNRENQKIENPYQMIISKNRQSVIIAKGSLPFIGKSEYDGYDYDSMAGIEQEVKQFLEENIIKEFAGYWR